MILAVTQEVKICTCWLAFANVNKDSYQSDILRKVDHIRQLSGRESPSTGSWKGGKMSPASITISPETVTRTWLKQFMTAHHQL